MFFCKGHPFLLGNLAHVRDAKKHFTAIYVDESEGLLFL